MLQSWSPAGSSRICRTSPPVGALLDDHQELRPARIRAGAQLVVLLEVRTEPRCGPVDVRVELAQRIPLPSRGELHPAEQLVAHQHPERPRCSAAPTAAALVPASGSRPAASASHSSSRLESTWRTSSPSHSMRSRSSSVFASSGMVCRARAVGVGEVAQHESLAALQAVVRDVLGEGHRHLGQVAHDGLRRRARSRRSTAATPCRPRTLPRAAARVASAR